MTCQEYSTVAHDAQGGANVRSLSERSSANVCATILSADAWPHDAALRTQLGQQTCDSGDLNAVYQLPEWLDEYLRSGTRVDLAAMDAKGADSTAYVPLLYG
jgi:hypothetical protein